MILNHFFEQLKTQFHQKLPFVAYKKPETSIIKGWLQKDDAIHYCTDFTESGFVFAPFDSNQSSFLIPFGNATHITHSFVKSDNMKLSDYISDSDSSQKDFHINLVKKGIDAIQQNAFKKVVLSRCEVVETNEQDPISIFEKLLNTYATAFVYCWYHPEVGLWLGATPETLLNIRGNRLKTMALAGTQAYKGSTDVFWKDKEREEQQIVTDFIVDQLQEAVGNGSSHLQMEVSAQHTIKAGNLLHLKTDIMLQLAQAGTGLKAIITALHPTPAVCGLPKEKAKTFIIAHEGYSREFYAGFLGELNLKETKSRNTNRRNVENNAYRVSITTSDLYVNLRCMQFKNNKVYIYVGGGITKDSDAVSEWEETVQKSQIIKRVLL